MITLFKCNLYFMEPALSIFIISLFFIILIVYLLLVVRKNSFLVKKVLELNLGQTINSSSRDGYLYLNQNLTILNYNCYVLKYFRLTEEELNKRCLSDLFDEFNTPDFHLIVEFVATQQQEYEFDLFIQAKASWYNLKLITVKNNGFILYLFENTIEKIEVVLSETERDVLEDFSMRTISFYEIFAKAMDRFQDLFKGSFLSVYLLNDTNDELYFFSSGYYPPIATVPKPIKNDFLGFQFLIKHEVLIEENNIYFNYLSELFTMNDFSVIFSSPFKSDLANKGVFFLHTIQDKNELQNIKLLNSKLQLFVKKLFDYYAIFREIEKLSIVSENAIKAFATLNLNGEITWNNQAFNQLFKLTKEELFLKHIQSLFNDQLLKREELDIINCGLVDFNQIDEKFEYRISKEHVKYLHLVTKKIFTGDHIQLLIEIDDLTESTLFEKQKKELINETQAFERNQFSMELHDGLAQQLVALNLYLTQIEPGIDEMNKDRYLICKQLVSESLQQTRMLCYTVSPPELEDGLIIAVKALYERLNRLNGVTFIVNEDQSLHHIKLDEIDNYNVFRIIQEFSNNSIKHADCSKITCELKANHNNKTLIIELKDNGIGFDFDQVKYGFGIQNMRKRANLMNAKISITSKIGSGSKLRLTLGL